MVWTKLEAKNMPAQRMAHKMIAVGNKIILFGGHSDVMSRCNDTFIYHTGTCICLYAVC